MQVFSNLNAEIARKGLKKTDIAKKLNISVNSLQNKLKGKQEFKLSEIQILLKIFPDKDMSFLFQFDKKNEIKS